MAASVDNSLPYLSTVWSSLSCSNFLASQSQGRIPSTFIIHATFYGMGIPHGGRHTTEYKNHFPASTLLCAIHLQVQMKTGHL